PCPNFLVAPRAGDQARRDNRDTAEPSKFAEEFCVFHQRYFGESSRFFEGSASAKEPVIAKAHAQKEAGIMRERIGQAVDETLIWNPDAKETAGYLRLTKDVGYLLKATGWHFAIGVNEPKSVARRSPRSGIHLNRATARSAQTRSEEHTSELQSLAYLVCRLL